LPCARPEPEYYYRISRFLAREHTFAIEPLVFQNKELADSRGRDGLFYAQYAPGLPIALVPLVLAGDRMKELMSGFAANYFWFYKSEGDIGPRVVASYFNILISAITVGLLTLLVVQLGYPVSAAFFTGLSLAVSTFAWCQARLVFFEPLQGLLFVAASLLLLRATRARSLMGGCRLALAILVKITSILALPAFLLLPNERGELLYRRRSTLVGLIVPVAIGLGAYGWYNWIRFGSFTAIGYSNLGSEVEFRGNALGNPFIGLYGLLLSSGRDRIVSFALFLIPRLQRKTQLKITVPPRRQIPDRSRKLCPLQSSQIG